MTLVVILLFVVPVVVGIRTRHTRIAVPIALLLTASAMFWVWMDRAELQALDEIQSVAGNRMVATYVGSECEDHRSVSVVEDESSVRIKVVTRSFSSSCSDVGMHHEVAVTLDRPLSTRKVVNVGCVSGGPGCTRVLLPPA